MPVFIKKIWSEDASVFPTGCTVRVNGKVLSVLAADGTNLARFIVQNVERHWIEDDVNRRTPAT